MTEAERRALEDARAACLASAEAITTVLAGTGSAAASPTRLGVPLGYVSAMAAAREAGLSKEAMTARARRARAAGSDFSRKIGGRWFVRLDRL